MRILFLPTVILCVLLAACATKPTTPNQIITGRTQPLMLRTDPPGAACSILQDSKLLATVDATPTGVDVPRDFTWFGGYGPPVEAIPPLEVVCRKDGYLEFRRIFRVAYAADVSNEETAHPEATPAEQAGAAIAGAAAAVGMAALPAAATPVAILAAAGSVVALPIAVGLTAAAIAAKAPPTAYYAYRTLPEFLLTPETFASQGACDDYFASLETRLNAARDTSRAHIDAECRFWPCRSSDPSPCPDPVCERLRKMTDDHLTSELQRIPALRAQVRIAAPAY